MKSQPQGRILRDAQGHFIKGHAGYLNSGSLKKGNIPWNKGVSPSSETRRKLRIFNLGKRHSLVTKQKLSEMFSGEKHYNWRGGRSADTKVIRRSLAYRTWRTNVFLRDDFTCQACGHRGGELNADHELPFALFPDLRFEVLNGRTLCVICHKKTETWGDRRAAERLHMITL